MQVRQLYYLSLLVAIAGSVSGCATNPKDGSQSFTAPVRKDAVIIVKGVT